jgi:ParB/RepB/Spo0J family partition protein
LATRTVQQGEELMEVDRISSDETLLRPVDANRVEELAASMASKGQQQAIKVRPKSGYRYTFVVVFGEHRLAAAKKLAEAGRSIKGLPVGKVRAIVADIDEYEALELKVTENAQRNHYVDPWEEGKVFVELLSKKYSNNINALAESLGKSTAYIRDRVQVYYFLHPSLRKYLGNGLTVSNAISLTKTPNPEPQITLANSILRTRIKGIGTFGGGGLIGRRSVKLTCQCPTCGYSHTPRKRTDSLSAEVDEAGGVPGIDVVMGSNRHNDEIHVHNPGKVGFSLCGTGLKETWTVKVPQDAEPRELGERMCMPCFNSWRRNLRP